MELDQGIEEGRRGGLDFCLDLGLCPYLASRVDQFWAGENVSRCGSGLNVFVGPLSGGVGLVQGTCFRPNNSALFLDLHHLLDFSSGASGVEAATLIFLGLRLCVLFCGSRGSCVGAASYNFHVLLWARRCEVSF